VESHPFGYAQGRLVRTERARMGTLFPCERGTDSSSLRPRNDNY
jgi:hypothetical protein